MESAVANLGNPGSDGKSSGKVVASAECISFYGFKAFGNIKYSVKSSATGKSSFAECCNGIRNNKISGKVIAAFKSIFTDCGKTYRKFKLAVKIIAKVKSTIADFGQTFGENDFACGVEKSVKSVIADILDSVLDYYSCYLVFIFIPGCCAAPLVINIFPFKIRHSSGSADDERSAGSKFPLNFKLFAHCAAVSGIDHGVRINIIRIVSLPLVFINHKTLCKMEFVPGIKAGSFGRCRLNKRISYLGSEIIIVYTAAKESIIADFLKFFGKNNRSGKSFTVLESARTDESEAFRKNKSAAHPFAVMKSIVADTGYIFRNNKVSGIVPAVFKSVVSDCFKSARKRNCSAVDMGKAVKSTVTDGGNTLFNNNAPYSVIIPGSIFAVFGIIVYHRAFAAYDKDLVTVKPPGKVKTIITAAITGNNILFIFFKSKSFKGLAFAVFPSAVIYKTVKGVVLHIERMIIFISFFKRRRIAVKIKIVGSAVCKSVVSYIFDHVRNDNVFFKTGAVHKSSCADSFGTIAYFFAENKFAFKTAAVHKGFVVDKVVAAFNYKISGKTRAVFKSRLSDGKACGNYKVTGKTCAVFVCVVTDVMKVFRKSDRSGDVVTILESIVAYAFDFALIFDFFDKFSVIVPGFFFGIIRHGTASLYF